MPWLVLQQRSLRNHLASPEPTSLEILELERRREMALCSPNGPHEVCITLAGREWRNEQHFFLTFPSSRPTSHSTSRCRDPSTTVCTRREGGRMAILAQLGLDGRHATLRGPDLTLQPPRAAQLGVPNGASGYGDFFCTTRLSHCSVHTSRAQRRRSQPERRMEQSGWAAGALRTPPCARSVRAVGRDEPFCELLTEFVS